MSDEPTTPVPTEVPEDDAHPAVPHLDEDTLAGELPRAQAPGLASATPATRNASATEGQASAPRARMRVGTVVWGVVLAVLGVGVVAWAAGAQIDAQAALIVLLGGAGVALLVGSLVTGLRGSRR